MWTKFFKENGKGELRETLISKDATSAYPGCKCSIYRLIIQLKKYNYGLCF